MNIHEQNGGSLVNELGNGYALREQVARPDRSGGGDVLSDRPRRLELLRGDEVVASAALTPAELSDGRATAVSDDTALLLGELTVRESDRATLACLLYCAARRARMMGRISIAMNATEARNFGVESMWKMVALSSSTMMQRVDLAAHLAAEALDKVELPVGARFRAQEVQEVARQTLDTAPQWGFFRAVQTRTLTREQYVYALSNIYQFVRHTTRLCGRAVSVAETTELRSHWIGHLNGEVNHEIIIERDLAHLGEDTEFVIHHMAPNGPTQEFMANQESLIGYRRDAILLMASPTAAEGVTGHLTEEFIAALKECIQSWGVDQPEKAARFFTSHMHTDGGDDGHWEMTIARLGTCLVSESKHQMFMRSLATALRTTRRLYDSFTAELPGVRAAGAESGHARAGASDAHAQA